MSCRTLPCYVVLLLGVTFAPFFSVIVDVVGVQKCQSADWPSCCQYCELAEFEVHALFSASQRWVLYSYHVYENTGPAQ